MEKVVTGHPVDRLEGSAPAVEALRAQIRRLAAFDAIGGPSVPTLLLQGETGTGKGLVARIVHDSGPRAGGPFVPVNCAAIPETMLEAEVFGHEPGAFTDARRAKPGLFEAAAGGTLFLDEIDSLGLALQSKLLMAIESKRVRRLGAVAERAVDVKLLAATQQDLSVLAAAGRFRPDLFHRLAVVVLSLPALRERGDDVIALARSVLERLAVGYGARPKRLTTDAETWLRQQRWPGNVRELGHLMERVTLLHSAATVDARALERLAAPSSGPVVSETPRGQPAPSPGAGERREGPDARRPPERTQDGDAAESHEVEAIRAALTRTGGNVVRAARLLGVSRDTIRYRMRLHGISRGDVDALPVAAPPQSPVTPRDERVVPADAEPRAGHPSAAVAAPEPAAPPHAPAWEQKSVALVAVSLTWPERDESAWSHEPWTEHRRWAGLIREKLSGLGGVPVQESPSLSVWAFGVPSAIDQLMERAVHGALAIRQAVAGMASRERVPELRLAVHHGAMLVDVASADPARGALAVGDTVALAVRLLGEAAAGELVTSADVADRVAAWARVEDRDVIGAATADARVCRIAGLRPWRERGSHRRLTPFVGRERELMTLRELVAAAETGAGQLVGIVGPPGSGKSRLLRELRRRLEGRGVVYNEAHALAHGTATPLLPFVEMARSHFDVTESDPPEVVREHVRAGLGEIGLDPEIDGPYMIALLGGERPANVDGETLRRRTFELIRRITVAFSERAPLLLTIENAHWLDPTSEACVASIAAHLGGARCVFVVTYRPGYRPGWLDRSYATQIALAPLSAADGRRMIAGVAAGRELPVALADQVIAWAEGNPLFLEELTRSVLEAGSITGAAVPESVHAVIEARMDRLTPDDKRLLQIAAVVGREVPHDVLERVAEVGPEPLHDGLARLQAAELLLERGARAVRTYGFRHALIQATAYQGVPEGTRGTLHLRVLGALVDLGAESRPEMLRTLAEHAAGGADWSRAVAYYRSAGLHLLARDANREAARCLTDALAALERLPMDDAPEALALAFDVRNEALQALYRIGETTRVGELAREGYRIAEQLGDAARLAQVLAALTHMACNEGRYEESMHVGVRTLELAAAHGLTMMGIWTGIMVGRTCLALGRFSDGVGYLTRAIETIGEDGDRRYAFRGVMPPSASARAYLALCLARTGQLDEATRQAEEAVRVAEAMAGPIDHVWTYYALGRAHHARTDWDRAIPVLERAAALCESEELLPYLPRVLAGLASAYAQSGRIADAVPLLERALAAGREIHFVYGETLILCQLGTTCVEAGHLDEAQRHATQALALSRERGERGEEAWALLLSGDVAARRGPATVEDARSWYAQAIALGDELGMRPLVARARLALGALECRVGRIDDARRHLAMAAAESKAMGITAWEKRAEELGR